MLPNSLQEKNTTRNQTFPPNLLVSSPMYLVGEQARNKKLSGAIEKKKTCTFWEMCLGLFRLLTLLDPPYLSRAYQIPFGNQTQNIPNRNARITHVLVVGEVEGNLLPHTLLITCRKTLRFGSCATTSKMDL